MTLKIDKYAHRNTTTIRLSGRMQAERFEHIGTAVAKRLTADGASVDNTYASSAPCARLRVIGRSLPKMALRARRMSIRIAVAWTRTGAGEKHLRYTNSRYVP
jgi:hypothetical protein